ncbi:MAG: cyclic nucleotide-binding domain-containing protein [bacterium]
MNRLLMINGIEETMECINALNEKKPFAVEELVAVLDESLKERDFFCRTCLSRLNGIGLTKNEALMLLAQYKSKIKYGYAIATGTLSHILRLVKHDKKASSLKKLAESPFFLIKACWLYEHAPYFFFFNEYKPEDLDTYITKFAKEYDKQFFSKNVSQEHWGAMNNPYRVMASSFWEKQIFDPLLLMEQAMNENIEGIEIAIDFHPFNYTKLLPEELSDEKRERIRDAVRTTGIRLDLHSPIVGPYYPSPNPRAGKQLFHNPLQCFDLQCENIQLAKDIGAGSVVVHLIDTSNLKGMTELVMAAGGSDVRVTVENYCLTGKKQEARYFIECVDEIYNSLPHEVRERNFGITLDVGHLNIEGEDPLVASEMIGRWCMDKGVFLRLHATDNYGNLLFSPPTYSADVHSNVAGLGINNEAIIKLLRSMGLRFDTVAEQIKPLSPDDISLIHKAQTDHLDKNLDEYIVKGQEQFSSRRIEELITPAVLKERAYLFLAGLKGTDSLREYLFYRKLQDRKYLSVEDAKKISHDFMKMPQKMKTHLIRYMDDLLLPVQNDSGAIQKNKLDSVCQNINGALFGTINSEHLNQIFTESRIYRKDEIICRQGTIGHEMYFVKEGEVNVTVKGTQVATLGPGEIFGEISLFYNVKRSATVKAVREKTKVGILNRKGFINLLRRSQPYSYDLIYRLYNILPERLRNINDKYKTAVDSIYLLLEGDDTRIPQIEDIPAECVVKMELIPPLSQEEAQMVFEDEQAFGPGQVIVSEGDEGDRVYFILEGRVKVTTLSSTGKEIRFGELGSEEIFGEMALIDNKPRSASVVTLVPTRVAFVRKHDFIDFLDTRSELAFRLMAYICLAIFKRMLKLDKGYADIKDKLVKQM